MKINNKHPSNIKYLSKESYYKTTKELEGGHWTADSVEARWDYHEKTIAILKKIKPTSESRVLEIGTMGVNCVSGSKTLDNQNQWNYLGKCSDYTIDARLTPWPIEDKQFEVLIALRVFQHLTPNQKEAFKEAVRVANHIIIVVNQTYNNKALPNSKGISTENFIEFFDGVPPCYTEETSLGTLYYWNTLKQDRKADVY